MALVEMIQSTTKPSSTPDTHVALYLAVKLPGLPYPTSKWGAMKAVLDAYPEHRKTPLLDDSPPEYRKIPLLDPYPEDRKIRLLDAYPKNPKRRTTPLLDTYSEDRKIPFLDAYPKNPKRRTTPLLDTYSGDRKIPLLDAYPKHPKRRKTPLLDVYPEHGTSSPLKAYPEYCPASLLEAYPEYRTTSQLGKLRATEYAYLDNQDHVYLDYTGSGLAAYAQRREHEERLSNTLCGNPHSVSPTSEAATHLIEQTRARILEYLKASPEEYAVIFTPNATGAARLVGEAYRFSRRTKLVLTSDNHNCINGLREFARRGHAKTSYVPTQAPDLRIDPAVLKSVLRRRSRWETLFESGPGTRRGLFAYPAQSNLSGVRHPLSWVRLAQKLGYDVLLDTAAYLPTETLDLSVVKPEFMIVSWYKLFGYPTGVGCLIARRSALKRLSRPWFSGGTIKAVTGIPWHEMIKGESAFEDGTVNFLSIPDVLFGLDWLANIGMDVIATRVRCLTGWFLDRLRRLEHSDGTPMVRIYGPKDIKARGGNVAFNFLDAAGKVVDERLVAEESGAARISLRTGCFCNPGAAESALGLDAQKLHPIRHAKMTTFDDFLDVVGLPSAGAIRVSFGIASNAADVDHFFAFAVKTYRDRITSSSGLTPRDGC
jgi:selenocysteine lyase/cysteine desulfurase